MKKSFSILFVCTGNTCRSPLAEVVMKAKLRKAGIRNVKVSSAGAAADEGTPVSENARMAARQLGLSLSGFRSRPLTQRRVRRADLILTMESSQKQDIVRTWPEATAKTFVISEFSNSKRDGISDPVGRSEEVYIDCAQDLEDEIRRILPKIKRMLNSKRRRR